MNSLQRLVFHGIGLHKVRCGYRAPNGVAVLAIVLALFISSCVEEPWQVAIRQATERQKAGDIAGAIELFERALVENPARTELYFELAKLYLESGQHTEAEKYIRKAVHVQPDNGHALLMLGFVHLRKGDLQAAEKTFSEALKYLKGEESGICYAHVGYLRYVEAMKERERAAEHARAGNLEDEGKARVSMAKKLEEAEQNLLLAIQEDPKLYMAHYNLGNIYLDQYLAKRKDRFGGAEVRHRSEKEKAFIEEKKAVLKEKLNLAISCYERAAALSHEFADVHKKLGILYDGYMPSNSESDRQKAIEHFERYLALVGNDTEVSERLKLLKKVK